MKKIKQLIVITGTPGVGKSSISALLASKTNAKLISLGDLVKKEKLYSGLDRKRDTLIADMEKVRGRVKSIINESTGHIIIEGHYAVDAVMPEEVNYVFVLRRDPQELKDVLMRRGYKEEKIRENLVAEILDVCLYDAVKRCGVDKVCEINVTGRSTEEVVNEILLVINGKKECKIGLVDWLGKLELEGKIDEYLKNF